MSILKKHTVNGASLAFIPSANVKVFPCAYRGYINTASIDPESKAQTEYNYVNLHNQLGKNKPSYVISYTSNTKILKCVVGGYYFEITGLEASDFEESGKQKYLAFKLKEIPLPSNDSSRKTKVLRSLIDINDDYLDTILEGSTYYFTGIALVENITGYDAYLAPFNLNGTDNWEEKTIHDVLDTGSGVYSLVMKCDNQANTASHKNSIALGEGTKTSADNQVVLGKYNKDSETSGDILVVGNGTGDTASARSNTFRLSKSGAIVMSSSLSAGGSISTSGTLTVAGNSTLRGSETLTGNLIVGGTTAISGNTSTSGTLTAAKKLTVSSEGAQITGNVNISSGSLTSAKKLTVTSEGADITGNTKISGTFEATGATTLKSTLNLTGNATLGGTVTAAKKLTVSSEGADITGNSKVTGTFEATGNTTLGGNLSVNSGVLKLKGDNTLIYNDASDKTRFEFNKPIHVTGTVTATGKMFAVDFEATGNSNVKGLEATGDINTTANMSASKVSASEMETTGAMKSGSLDTGNVSAAAVSASSLSTTGNATISGTSTVGKLVTGTEGAEIKGATTITGATTLSGGATISGTTSVATLTASGNLTVSGTSNSIAGTLTLGGGTGIGTVLDASAGGAKIGAVTISSAGAISGATSISASSNITSSGGYVKAGTYMEAPYFNATSDRRLKQNIKDYICPNSILDLPIKEYEYIDMPGKVHVGCLAQDLQEICPELVNTNDSGYLVIEESKLVYLLIQEVKNLKDKIEKLENK